MTDRDLDLLETVLQSTRDIVDRLEADDFDRPTPCDELDVRRLLEHVIGWQQVMGACAGDLEPALTDGSPTYRVSEHVAEDLQAASATLLGNLRRRPEDTITLPYRGATSVAVMQSEQIAEYVIHTWDLAAAVGLPVTFDDDVLRAAHDGLTLLLGESFAEIGFRPPAAGDHASDELARLLVRSGRTPAEWASVR